MNINTYGYMRVSSADQNEDRQKIELLTWGVPAGNLFCDKLSGKNFSRPEYQKLKTLLKKGAFFMFQACTSVLGASVGGAACFWTSGVSK